MTPPTTDLEGLIARLREPLTMSMFISTRALAAEAERQRSEAADALEAQSTLLAEMAEALSDILGGMEASGGWEGDDDLFDAGMNILSRYDASNQHSPGNPGLGRSHD